MAPDTKRERSTDSRALYTQNAIKDALLEAMAHKSFERITVSEVCRLAQITRSTYYLRYQSLSEVLDDLLTDALRLAEEGTSPALDARQTVSQLISDMMDDESLLPVCHRVAMLPKYQVIFRDESISSYVVNKIYQSQKENLIAKFMAESSLTRPEAEMLSLFHIYGTYYVNKALRWERNETWYQVHAMLLRFNAGGMERLK